MLNIIRRSQLQARNLAAMATKRDRSRVDFVAQQQGIPYQTLLSIATQVKGVRVRDLTELTVSQCEEIIRRLKTWKKS